MRCFQGINPPQIQTNASLFFNSFNMSKKVLIARSEHGHHSHDSAGHEGRMVVFGDVDWANNRLAPQDANRQLFLDTVTWLAANGDDVDIKPHTRPSSSLVLTPRKVQLLQLVSMDLVPLLLMGVGAAVVVTRRRR